MQPGAVGMAAIGRAHVIDSIVPAPGQVLPDVAIGNECSLPEGGLRKCGRRHGAEH